MPSLEIITKAPKAIATETNPNGKPEGWQYAQVCELPDTAEGLCDTLTSEVVLDLALAQFKIQFQSVVRRLAEAGKPDEEITAIMTSWKPGDKVETGLADPIARMTAKFATMSREEQAQFLSSLQQQAAAANTEG